MEFQILDTSTLQWSAASSLPQKMFSPQMAYCQGCLYLSGENIVYHCFMEELLTSCKPKCEELTWTRLADIPLVSNYGPGLATIRGYVLAVGGRSSHNCPTDLIHCYDKNKNVWSVIGRMQYPRSHVLSTVLPSGHVVVVGGRREDSNLCALAEVGTFTYWPVHVNWAFWRRGAGPGIFPAHAQ